MKNYILIIRADTNDGDYITDYQIADQEKLDLIIKIAKQLMNAKRNSAHGEDSFSWPTSEYARFTPLELYGDEINVDYLDLIDWMVPFGEFGVHTVESIRYFELASEETLILKGE